MQPASPRPFGKTLKQVLAEGCLGFDSSVQAALVAIADTSAELSQRLRTAALDQALGRANRHNVFGDDVQKLDAEANTRFCMRLSATRACIAIASEELEAPILHEGRTARASVMLDPLDGSGNLDSGLSVGSIFGIHGGVYWPSHDQAFLRKGRELTAAGYVLYGSRTILVLASRTQAMAFDLDAQGDYVLTEPALVCPQAGAQYSVNEAYQDEWDPATRAWLSERRKLAPGGARASLRYDGALVADAHRALVQGGVFAYPGTSARPEGKLRLLYEVNPMAFVFEAAGGRASTGLGSPLDQAPRSLQQRSPVVLGSQSDVARYEAAFARERAAAEAPS